jgi:hypothetical protein
MDQKEAYPTIEDNKTAKVSGNPLEDHIRMNLSVNILSMVIDAPKKRLLI